MSAVEIRVLQFIQDSTGGASVRSETDIFAEGIANSLFALQLIQFIERQFEIVITDDDLELDNFRSARAVARFVERKLSDVRRP